MLICRAGQLQYHHAPGAPTPPSCTYTLEGLPQSPKGLAIGGGMASRAPPPASAPNISLVPASAFLGAAPELPPPGLPACPFPRGDGAARDGGLREALQRHLSRPVLRPGASLPVRGENSPTSRGPAASAEAHPPRAHTHHPAPARNE